MPACAGMTRVSPLKLHSATLCLTLLLAAFPALADVQGRVVTIHDGDTMTVLIDHRQVRVRLVDIDAPELKQPFGTRSRQSLSNLCFGKVASLDIRGRDRYNRTLARVTCSGADANAEQVRRGYAWTFVRYARADSPLFAIEREARAAHRGLWQDPAPVAPWDWRRSVQQSSRPTSARTGS